jgi:hypothetical protein
MQTMFNMLMAFYPRHFDHRGALEFSERAAS